MSYTVRTPYGYQLPSQDPISQNNSQVTFYQMSNEKPVMLYFGTPEFWDNGMSNLQLDYQAQSGHTWSGKKNATTVVNGGTIICVEGGPEKVTVCLPISNEDSPIVVGPKASVTFVNNDDQNGVTANLFFDYAEFWQTPCSRVTAAKQGGKKTMRVSKSIEPGASTHVRATTVLSANTLQIPGDIINQREDSVTTNNNILFSNPGILKGGGQAYTLFFSNPNAWNPPREKLTLSAGQWVILNTTDSATTTEVSMASSKPQDVRVPEDVGDTSFEMDATPHSLVTFKNTSNAPQTVFFQNPAVWDGGQESINLPANGQKTLKTSGQDGISTKMATMVDDWSGGDFAILNVKQDTVYAKIIVTN